MHVLQFSFLLKIFLYFLILHFDNASHIRVFVDKITSHTRFDDLFHELLPTEAVVRAFSHAHRTCASVQARVRIYFHNSQFVIYTNTVHNNK